MSSECVADAELEEEEEEEKEEGGWREWTVRHGAGMKRRRGAFC